MAYDEELANRFRQALDGLQNIVERRMMGGICFMMNGNMLGGADKQKDGQRRFMFRVGKDNMASALQRPGAENMEVGGRRMSGFVFVDACDCDEKSLQDWIDLARSFVDTLPAK